MNRNKLFWLLLVLFLALVVSSVSEAKTEPQSSQNKEPILVGRISYLEGRVLRYVPETKEWVAVARDFPFGLDESLYAAKGGKAELIMPNNTWARIGDSTQIQLILV